MKDLAPLFRFRGLLLAVAAAVVLAVSFVVPPAELPGVPVCMFRNVTGLPCPGCGLTRAFCAISHGQFSSAWEYNPFGYLFYAGAVALLLYPAVSRLRPGIDDRLLRSRILSWGLPLLAVAMVAFDCWRIAAGTGP